MKHNLCIVFENHHQTKIPYGPVKGRSRMRALIQIQTYNIVAAVRTSKDDDELLLNLRVLLASQEPSSVGAHLCKQKCNRVGHTRPNTARNTNQVLHEACPSYWIIRDSLVNYCTCDTTQCIAPGGVFIKNSRERFQEVLEYTIRIANKKFM